MRVHIVLQLQESRLQGPRLPARREKIVINWNENHSNEEKTVQAQPCRLSILETHLKKSLDAHPTQAVTLSDQLRVPTVIHN